MRPRYGVAPPGYRLPDSTTVGPVSLRVLDLERSIGYYQHVLGLQVIASSGDGAALGPHDSRRALVELHARPGTRPAPPRGTTGLYHFAILLPDRQVLGRFAAHLLRRNVRFGMADHLVSEALYLTDPDGLGIEVYADRPRETWTIRDGELAMTTDPLDLRDVMRAGGEATYAGMPPGTVMGHVHLHVGDLLEAEEFFHRGVGLDKTVWSYPGALFLSAGGYHHHLGTNVWARNARPAEDQARLLEWRLQVPTTADPAEAAASLQSAGYAVEPAGVAWVAADPWHTRLRIVPTDVPA